MMFGFRLSGHYCAVVLGCLILAIPVWAAPTALIQMPTADVVGDGQACVDIAADLPIDGPGDLSNWVLETDVGVSRSTELGFDTPLDSFEDGAFFAKKGFQPGGPWAAAVGVNGLRTDGCEENPYVVLSSMGSRLRTHLGLDYSEATRWRGMVGFDYAATDRVLWMGDWYTGPEGASSLGMALSLDPEGWGLMAGVIRQNSNGDLSVYVNLGCVFASFGGR